MVHVTTMSDLAIAKNELRQYKNQRFPKEKEGIQDVTEFGWMEKESIYSYNSGFLKKINK